MNSNTSSYICNSIQWLSPSLCTTESHSHTSPFTHPPIKVDWVHWSPLYDSPPEVRGCSQTKHCSHQGEDHGLTSYFHASQSQYFRSSTDDCWPRLSNLRIFWRLFWSGATGGVFIVTSTALVELPASCHILNGDAISVAVQCDYSANWNLYEYLHAQLRISSAKTLGVATSTPNLKYLQVQLVV